MAEMSRRNVIGGAAAAGGFMVAATSGQTARAEGGQPRFGPTLPPLAGKELPSFRFALGAQAAKAYDGGWAKEATVAEFPVSEKLAGVLMQVAPGALRELHWHANGAEWGYVIKGRCRLTTIDPQAHSEVVDFDPGDVWYLPRGHGHSIQGLGPDDCQFILVFDNGYFSEFGTFSEFAAGDVGYVPQGYGHYIENVGAEDIEVVLVLNNGSFESISITAWMAATPGLLLATNFGVPESTFADFPKRETIMPE